MVDEFGTPKAFEENVALEYQRNIERYQFLKWGAVAFDNFAGGAARHRHLPPGQSRIYRPRRVEHARSRRAIRATEIAYPDTLVGTDSHTTMVNGLGVLGWGVGGIEAEAAMLGQPVSMIIPEVVGFHLTGALKEGITATDLVLTVTQMLRAKGVVGRFVEFFGPGVSALSVADRATIANMAPEYGATCGFFPIDHKTLEYMRLTGRPEEAIALTEAYCQGAGHVARRGRRRSGVHRDAAARHVDASSRASPAPSGRRTRCCCPRSTRSSGSISPRNMAIPKPSCPRGSTSPMPNADGVRHDIGHGDVVIAAITSCTNTSNPSVLVAAGLVARKARALGLDSKPWVKTRLAPGCQVVTDYLDRAGLSEDLNAIGFDLVGYGCTTCIGNSGPLPEAISASIHKNDLVAASVLSGNRNFEGRVSPDVRANYLASPPLVVAYALKGTVVEDMVETPIGQDQDGDDVYPQGHLAVERRDPLADRPVSSTATCSARAMPTSTRATRAGRRSRSPAARPMPGRRARPTSPTRPISRACR